jgi:hypothetical protein
MVWFMACNKCKDCVHGSWSSYRWDAYERWSILSTGVTPVALGPLVTIGNLGASSCLDVVEVLISTS